jgi:glutathionylspermidine synthase
MIKRRRSLDSSEVAKGSARAMSTRSASDAIFRYRERRQRFFDLYRRRWPGTLNEPFDILDPRPVQRGDMEDIRRAARAVVGLYQQISYILRKIPKAHFYNLGLPEEAAFLAGIGAPINDLLLARLDFVQSKQGPKLLECNFDTPGLIVETFAINRLACKEIGATDPNASARGALSQCLHQAVESSAKHLAKPISECRVRICARSQYARDVDSAWYIVRALKQKQLINVDYVPLEQIQTDDDGLYDSRGHKIDMLVRLYPLYEFCRWGIPHRKNPRRTLDHRMLYEFFKRKQLVMMNTTFAAVLETKAIQALIWKLYESNTFFRRRNRQIIQRYFLKTTLERPHDLEQVIMKPMYGRGGSNVILSDTRGNIWEKGRTSHNREDRCVYQEYIEPPAVVTMTEAGVQTLRVIVSAWVIDGRHAGICYRTGHGITDAAWWMSPIYIEGENQK